MAVLNIVRFKGHELPEFEFTAWIRFWEAREPGSEKHTNTEGLPSCYKSISRYGMPLHYELVTAPISLTFDETRRCNSLNEHGKSLAC
jgi:hypothetical protein